MSDLSAFRRSRIYAQGWNAARAPRKNAINPYTSEPEKSRWDEGYANALKGNRQQVRFIPSRAEADLTAE
jgi:ribosome modulation factor